MEFLWTFKKKNTINPYLLTERPEVTPKNICIELNRYLIEKPVTINSHVWAQQARKRSQASFFKSGNLSTTGETEMRYLLITSVSN